MTNETQSTKQFYLHEGGRRSRTIIDSDWRTESTSGLISDGWGSENPESILFRILWRVQKRA